MRKRLPEILSTDVKCERDDHSVGPLTKPCIMTRRYHPDAEEGVTAAGAQGQSAGKQWCKKIVLAVRYLRTNGRNLRKLLDKVAKDATLVDKIYAGCLDKWGNVPPAAGGSEDYSDEILDLSTPEWLDTAQGEAEPVTPSGTPSSTRMPTEETETEHSWHARKTSGKRR